MIQNIPLTSAMSCTTRLQLGQQCRKIHQDTGPDARPHRWIGLHGQTPGKSGSDGGGIEVIPPATTKKGVGARWAVVFVGYQRSGALQLGHPDCIQSTLLVGEQLEKPVGWCVRHQTRISLGSWDRESRAAMFFLEPFWWSGTSYARGLSGGLILPGSPGSLSDFSPISPGHKAGVGGQTLRPKHPTECLCGLFATGAF